MTLDGCIGGPGRTPLKISNPEDEQRVHALRAASDAVLVGVGTVLADDPKLTVKWELLGRSGQNPLRVVLDAQLRTPAGARVLDRNAPTILFAASSTSSQSTSTSVEVVGVQRGELDLHAVLDSLERRGVLRLMVEGGSRVLTSFFRGNLVDAATIFVSPQVLGSPEAPRLTHEPWDLRQYLRLEAVEPLGDGVLLTWERA